MKRTVFSMVGALCALIVLMVLVGASSVTAAELVLYTASNTEIEKNINAAFMKAYPNIKLKTINLSTGPITERAITEKANPQADVIWMVNDIALEQLKQAGVLQPYQPKNSPALKEFRDPDGFYVNHNATLMAMAVNTNMLKKRNMPKPTSWEDLIKPIYKGQISIASPTQSGTGLCVFTTLWDAFGWNYIDNLHQNIFAYQESGSAAARMCGQGEIAIGLSYDGAIMQQVAAGLPVEMVLGGISPNVKEGAGLILGAPHPKEAMIFMDWLFSEQAAKVFAPDIGIGAIPGYGMLKASKAYLWKMRRPVNSNEFKREWAAKYEKK